VAVMPPRRPFAPDFTGRSECPDRRGQTRPSPRRFPVSHLLKMLLGRRDSLVYCGQVGDASDPLAGIAAAIRPRQTLVRLMAIAVCSFVNEHPPFRKRAASASAGS
jgi:hypothetical protein